VFFDDLGRRSHRVGCEALGLEEFAQTRLLLAQPKTPC
jgi:hypothetical protein